jgi:hypothetical protein
MSSLALPRRIESIIRFIGLHEAKKLLVRFQPGILVAGLRNTTVRSV